MIDLIEKNYLTPSNNKAIPILKCFFCEKGVFMMAKIITIINVNHCCEDCLNIHLKFTAELPDYYSQYLRSIQAT